jgi:signal transduction histidine kinase
MLEFLELVVCYLVLSLQTRERRRMHLALLFLAWMSGSVTLTDSASVDLRVDHVVKFSGMTASIPIQAQWNDLPEHAFRALPPGSRLEFGRNAPPALLRVILHPPEPGRWWLVSTLRTPGNLEARLGHDSLGAFGSAHPFDEQPVGTLDLSIPLDLVVPADTLYLKVSEPLGPCDLDVRFVPNRLFPARVQAQAIRSGLEIGYLVAILLVALYLWWAIRERAFGWYVAYLASAIAWISVKQGVAFTMIWPDHPGWNPHASPSFAFACIGFLSLFLIDLIDLRKNLPQLVFFLFAMTGLTFLLSAVSWWDEPTRSLIVRSVANTNLMALVLALLGCLCLRAFRKDPLATQILLSFSPLAFGMVFGVLVEFGVGKDGPSIKSGILAVSAILENALTTLVLVREVHRREKARIMLERNFHQRVVARTDDQMEELAQELHDGLSQQAASIRMRLFSLRPKELESDISEIGTEMERFSQEIRRISHRIHPPLLENGFLVGAITQLCQEMGWATASIEFLHPEEELQVPRTLASHLYRIVQEALSNAIRHGNASHIKVDIYLAKDRLNLTVADDGLGFSVGGTSSGLGLWSIRSRVETLGGTFQILSSRSRGTRLVIEVPHLDLPCLP